MLNFSQQLMDHPGHGSLGRGYYLKSFLALYHAVGAGLSAASLRRRRGPKAR